MEKFDKKILLSNIFRRLGVYKCIHSIKKNCLLVINYHRLYDQSLLTAFDPNVFEHSAETFEQHLKFIKSNFTVVSEEDVVQMVNLNRISDRCALITFDDGYIDNYTLAYPLLKAYNLPAVFFIPTESINERKLGWWDIIAYVIKKSQKEVIALHDRKFSLSTSGEKQQAIDYSIHFIKMTPFEKSRSFVENLATECEVAIPSKERQSSQLMQWKHIVEIAENGIAIGSHTHSHRILSGLSTRQQMVELQKAKDILENRLRCTIRSLSYPVGGYAHFSNTTKELAEKTGYSLAFSYNTGMNNGNISDRFDIKRFSLSNDTRLIEGQLFLPSLFVHCC